MIPGRFPIDRPGHQGWNLLLGRVTRQILPPRDCPASDGQRESKHGGERKLALSRARPEQRRCPGGFRLFRKEGTQMSRSRWIAPMIALLVLVTASAFHGQGGGRAPGRGGGRGMRSGMGAEGATDAERIKSALQRIGLSDKEQAAAEKALTAKLNARQALRDDLDKLRQVASNKQASQQQLKQAIDAYTKAMGRYRALVQEEDLTLSTHLSLRGRVSCLAAGVLDNELGMGGRTRTGTEGRGGSRGGGAPRGGPGAARGRPGR